jgi:hypothetical protein
VLQEPQTACPLGFSRAQWIRKVDGVIYGAVSYRCLADASTPLPYSVLASSSSCCIEGTTLPRTDDTTVVIAQSTAYIALPNDLSPPTDSKPHFIVSRPSSKTLLRSSLQHTHKIILVRCSEKCQINRTRYGRFGFGRATLPRQVGTGAASCP